MEVVRITGPLAANQGIYNAFLCAGLIWGLIDDSASTKSFFLATMSVAGVFGALTVNTRIFFVQSVPSIIGVVFVQFAWKDATNFNLKNNPVYVLLYILVGCVVSGLCGFYVAARENKLNSDMSQPMLTTIK